MDFYFEKYFYIQRSFILIVDVNRYSEVWEKIVKHSLTNPSLNLLINLFLMELRYKILLA